MNISTNLFDCAVKQAEQDVINEKMAEFLARGGQIRTATNVGVQSNFCQENKADLAPRAQSVLDSIKAGRTTPTKIAQAVNFSTLDVQAILSFLLKQKLIEKVGRGVRVVV